MEMETSHGRALHEDYPISYKVFDVKCSDGMNENMIFCLEYLNIFLIFFNKLSI